MIGDATTKKAVFLSLFS